MSEDKIPYIGSEGYFDMDDEELKIWDNTLMDGLKEIEVDEVIDKIRNYYNNLVYIILINDYFYFYYYFYNYN